jgi:putative transferase (TIGR04331 family)
MESKIKNPVYVFNYFLDDGIERIPNNYLMADKDKYFGASKEIYGEILGIYTYIKKMIRTQMNMHYRDNFPWDKLIGDWLSFIVEKYVLRHTTAKRKINENKIVKYYTHFKEDEVDNKRPLDKEEAFLLYNSSFIWNEKLQIYILKKLNCEIIYLEIEECKYKDEIKYTDKKNVKKINYIYKVVKFTREKLKFLTSNKYIVIDFYGSFLSTLLLSISKRTIPILSTFYTFEFEKVKNRLCNGELMSRTELLNDKDKIVDLYIREIYEFVVTEMPVIYLTKLKENIDELTFLDHTKTLITSNATISNDLVNFYALLKKEKINSKIHLIQHGASYFTNIYHRSRDIEIEAADSFFAWGNEVGQRNVVTIGVTKKLFKSKKSKKEILICGPSFTKFFENLSQYDDDVFWKYNQIMRDFISNLESDKIHQLRYRRLKIDSGRNEDFLTRILPESQLDTNKNLSKSAKQHSLIICLVDSTVFLECLASNFPVIGVWPNFDKFLTPDAMKLYNHAREIGLIYNSGKEAAIWLNLNSEVITEWWDSERTILVKEMFKNMYCSSFQMKILCQ